MNNGGVIKGKDFILKSGVQKLVYLAFFISGSVGLVYEVIWQRKLALIFGTTLPATTAVLAAFMGGIALGSWLFGRIAGSVKNPFRLYGILEIGIGIYCALMPLMFNIVTDLHVYLYGVIGTEWILELTRFFMAIIILSLPCALMGGTLPILSQGIIKNSRVLGAKLSWLYFLNTLGAATGTLLAGFALIRFLGVFGSNLAAAIVNVILGIIIIVATQNETVNVQPEKSLKTPSLQKTKSYLPWIYAVLGASAMGTEVAWTRSLNLVLGSTVYAFAMMLSSYLLGIAVGSQVMGKTVDRHKKPIILVCIFGFLVSVCIGLSIALIGRLPVLLLALFPAFHDTFIVWQGCLFGLSLLVVAPATFFMGALFPAMGKAYVNEVKEVGKQVAHLYLFNTLGGIAGCILAGFVLIPTIGTHVSLGLFAGIFLIVSLSILIKNTNDKKQRAQILLLIVICIAGYFSLPKWDAALLDSGVYVYAPQLLEGFEVKRKILFEEEGYHSHVTVSEKNNTRSLRINGKTDGSDGGDLTTQSLLAVLPLAHINDPENLLIVGLGTGVTAGSALNFPKVHVSCVEIDSSVIKAARYFNHVSGDPFSNDRFEVLHADARTILSAAADHYDVIISEPSNPWITGVSNLFTVEYFKHASSKLDDKGVMCQWIHSYYMDTTTLMTIFRTFQHVYPNCSLWAGSDGDYLMLGSHHEHLIDVNYSQMFRIGAVRDDLKRVNILSPDQFSDRLILDHSEFLTMTQKTGYQINTDNRPVVEFNAPQSLYRETLADNANQIMQFQVN